MPSPDARGRRTLGRIRPRDRRTNWNWHGRSRRWSRTSGPGGRSREDRMADERRRSAASVALAESAVSSRSATSMAAIRRNDRAARVMSLDWLWTPRASGERSAIHRTAAPAQHIAPGARPSLAERTPIGQSRAGTERRATPTLGAERAPSRSGWTQCTRPSGLVPTSTVAADRRLRIPAERERERADRAEQGRDQAEQARDAERARADALREQIDAEQAEARRLAAELASAEQAVEGERARADELASAGRGPACLQPRPPPKQRRTMRRRCRPSLPRRGLPSSRRAPWLGQRRNGRRRCSRPRTRGGSGAPGRGSGRRGGASRGTGRCSTSSCSSVRAASSRSVAGCCGSAAAAISPRSSRRSGGQGASGTARGSSGGSRHASSAAWQTSCGARRIRCSHQRGALHQRLHDRPHGQQTDGQRRHGEIRTHGSSMTGRSRSFSATASPK